MSQTIADLTITPSAWVDVFSITGISQSSPLLLQNKSGRTHIDYVISDTEPTLDYDFGGIVPKYPDNPTGMPIYTAGSKLWVKTHQINAILSVEDATALLGVRGGFPDGIFTGFRAINTQGYEETNKKLGSQWVASRRLTGVADGAKFYSVIKTRTLPMDLKARDFSYTGGGVIARIFENFTLSAPLGTPEDVYSSRPAQPAFRDFDLYAVQTPTDLGTPWAADVFWEGSQQTQGKGENGASRGSGWIIDSNKEILLEFESLDTQNISASLSMYNGFLDLPIP